MNEYSEVKKATSVREIPDQRTRELCKSLWTLDWCLGKRYAESVVCSFFGVRTRKKSQSATIAG